MRTTTSLNTWVFAVLVKPTSVSRRAVHTPWELANISASAAPRGAASWILRISDVAIPKYPSFRFIDGSGIRARSPELASSRRGFLFPCPCPEPRLLHQEPHVAGGHLGVLSVTQPGEETAQPAPDYDSIRFHFRETGEGVPFLFQHGLGASVEQPFGLFTPPIGCRMMAMDCRGHGKTEPLGDPQSLRIATFADDLLAMLDHLRIERAVVGGISLGAAIALNFTLRFRERTLGLVQSRPAWLAEPNPRTAQWFGEIARLIRQHGPQESAGVFRRSATYQQVLQESPDVAQSLLKQFANPRVGATVATLEQLKDDQPCHSLEQLSQIRVPTLVLANRQDPIHPFEYGQTIAAAIPGAEFQELTAKSVSLPRHLEDLQKHLGGFLHQFMP